MIRAIVSSAAFLLNPRIYSRDQDENSHLPGTGTRKVEAH